MLGSTLRPLMLAAGGALLISSAPALAQTTHHSGAAYDGYCYQKNSQARTKGTVIGAAGGAVLGNVVAGKGNKTEGTVLGGILGGIIGNQVAKNQQNKNPNIECLYGRYYIFENGYYEPDAAPSGYTVTYFYQRPDNAAYYVRRNGYDYEWRDHTTAPNTSNGGLRPYGQ
ncbi:MAG: glycine zipper 2TM domain-containing protein [Asticcacaulis sp.]